MDSLLIAINVVYLPVSLPSIQRHYFAGLFLHITIKILLKNHSEKACDCVIDVFI